MLKLRKVLLCKWVYYILFLLVLTISLIRLYLFPNISKYERGETEFEGKIVDIFVDGNKLSINIIGKELLLGTYYIQTEDEKQQILRNYELGDHILLKGILKEIPPSTIPNSYNYKEQLSYQKIFYYVKIDTITKIKSNSSILYKVKNRLIHSIETSKSAPYLKTLILGDQREILPKVKESYQKNGVSHLFAISGMHITFLSSFILKGLKKIKRKEKSRYLITLSFLLFYLLITGCSISTTRAVIFFFLLSINKMCNFYIRPFHLLLVTAAIVLIHKPYSLLDIGFQFSFGISGTLLLCSNLIGKQKNYILKLAVTSLLSFCVSIPISLYHFYQINIGSIIYNLIFVPLVTYIIFPLAIITMICPILDPIFLTITKVLESFSLLLETIEIGRLIFRKPSQILIVFYSIAIYFSLYQLTKRKKRYLLVWIFSIFIHYIDPFYNPLELYMIDVGQGDSILLHSKHQNILIDTGGIMSYKDKKWKQRKYKKNMAQTKLIPFFQSLGIRKLDAIFITHGDADHSKETNNIIDRIKVEKVYFNEGDLTPIEEDIKKKVKSENIDYEIAEKGNHYVYGPFQIYSLNKDLKNENDSSLILYIQANDYTMLFMGDASAKSEKSIMKEYILPKVDILKIGHHGSRTSSIDEFLIQTSPKLALISAGVENKFSHPHKELLTRLRKKNIPTLVTNEVGSIKINLKNGTITTYRT